MDCFGDEIVERLKTFSKEFALSHGKLDYGQLAKSLVKTVTELGGSLTARHDEKWHRVLHDPLQGLDYDEDTTTLILSHVALEVGASRSSFFEALDTYIQYDAFKKMPDKSLFAVDNDEIVPAMCADLMASLEKEHAVVFTKDFLLDFAQEWLKHNRPGLVGQKNPFDGKTRLVHLCLPYLIGQFQLKKPYLHRGDRVADMPSKEEYERAMDAQTDDQLLPHTTGLTITTRKATRPERVTTECFVFRSIDSTRAQNESDRLVRQGFVDRREVEKALADPDLDFTYEDLKVPSPTSYSLPMLRGREPGEGFFDDGFDDDVIDLLEEEAFDVAS